MDTLFICDDDQPAVKYYREILKEISLEEKLPFVLKTFSSGEEMLTAYDQQAPLLILLDIEMSGIDGIETARRMRVEKQYQGALLFLTNHDKVVMDSLDLGVERCLKKSLPVETVKQELRTMVKQALQQRIEITFDSLERGSQSILLNKLLTISAVGFGKRKLLVLKTTDGEQRIQGSLERFEEELETLDFCRVNKHTLVYLKNVQAIQDDALLLIDGTKVKMNRQNKRIVTEKILAAGE
ncbi:DNA-binding response regulator [Enterococcus florum]|uniref:DNA-binding response regulator n=1 Tax=Enterococcus florum TaxID=2480627 RepID=A0A4P5PAE5_9ENTE|nr:response regulator [Enterococcus florum]GCF95075.1 DNA-binding response regulator [Enterococcus florum]